MQPAGLARRNIMRSIRAWSSIPLAVLMVSSIEGTAGGRVSFVRLGGADTGLTSTDSKTPETRGRRIVANEAAVNASSLVTSGVDHFSGGETIVRYAQTHHGLPVIGRGASVRFSAAREPLATVVDLEREL